MKTNNLKQLTKLSICIALLCVSAYLAVPVGTVPLTAQTIMLFLAALLLPPAQAVTCTVIYLLLGVCGLPVFSGGTSGIGILFSPAGGFLMTFPLAAFAVSILKGKNFRFSRAMTATLVAGIPVLYLGGVSFLMLTQNLSFFAACSAGVLPFLPGDLLKGIGAVYLAGILHKRL